MPFQDFREFVDALRKAGELLEVDRAVSPELEVAKAMRKSAAVSGPAIIFNNNGTAFPLAGGFETDVAITIWSPSDDREIG